MSTFNTLSKVHKQVDSDRKRLDEIKQEWAETTGILDHYVEQGHWLAAADMCNRLWSLEGFQKLLEARIEIDTEWLASVKPGQPTTDYDG